MLVTFPVIGIVAILWIGVLMLQKFRLQTRLEDSSWWMINFSDITIIREPSVRSLSKGWRMVSVVNLLHRFVCFIPSRESRVHRSALQEATVGAAAVRAIFPATAMT